MPILSRLDDEIRGRAVSDWKSVFARSGIRGILESIGEACLDVIQDAFNTGGFGRWRKLQEATIKRKGSTTILQDTDQLRRSISYAVVVKGGGK